MPTTSYDESYGAIEAFGLTAEEWSKKQLDDSHFSAIILNENTHILKAEPTEEETELYFTFLLATNLRGLYFLLELTGITFDKRLERGETFYWNFALLQIVSETDAPIAQSIDKKEAAKISGEHRKKVNDLISAKAAEDEPWNYKFL